MSRHEHKVYEFGEFRLSTEGTLERNGETIPITPKMFEVLSMLVDNPGRIVTREELLETVWADSFVEEGNLTVTIRQLRKALGDDAQSPAYIQTIARRGYKLISDVRVVDEGANGRPVDDQQLKLVDGHHAQGNAFSASSERASPAVAPVVALSDWKRDAEVENEDTTGRPTPLELVPPTRATDARPLGFLMVSAVVIAAVALTAFVVYRFWPAPTGPAPAPSIDRLTSNGKVVRAAISPDAKFVAYVVEEAKEKHTLFLKNIPTESETLISESPESIVSLTFSSDGSHLFIGARTQTYRIPVLGGPPKQVLKAYGYPIAISPDASRIALIRYEGTTSALFVADVDGANETRLAQAASAETFLRSPAWSPDGRTIAVVRLNQSGNQEIALVNVNSGSISSLPSIAWSTIWSIVWLGNGDRLAVVAEESDKVVGQLWSVSYPDGAATRITTDSNNYRSVSSSSDGSTLALVRHEQESHLWLYQADKVGEGRQLSSGFEKYDGVYSMSWTADGRIVYDNAPSGKFETWQTDADGKNQRRLTEGVGSSGISPDGKFLVYQSRDANGLGLFRMSMENGEIVGLTTGTDLDPAFTPDGQSIVFTRYAEDVALWKVPLAGGTAIKLTDFEGHTFYPSVSPDGKLIAFILQAGGRASALSIDVISIDGGDILKTFEVQMTKGAHFGKLAVQWTADGQAIDFVSDSGGVANIWRQPLDGRPPVQLTKFDSGLIFNFAYSLDRKQVAMSRGHFARDVVLVKLPQSR